MRRDAPRKTVVCWSSGKDSAWTLHRLRLRPEYEVVGLMTTFSEPSGRVSMHSVRRELVERQAEASGLPLHAVEIPERCANEVYEAAMAEFARAAWEAGVSCVAFGDLFLEDIRAYRESRLAGSGLEPVFPLWGAQTDALAREMVAGGLRARVTCVDTTQLDARFVGREFDGRFLDELPGGVDPCGERGEFHTFAFDGPVFARPVAVEAGARMDRDQFAVADLVAG